MKQKRLKFQTKQSLNYLVRDKDNNKIIWIRNSYKSQYIDFDLWFDWCNNINKKLTTVRSTDYLEPILKKQYE